MGFVTRDPAGNCLQGVDLFQPGLDERLLGVIQGQIRAAGHTGISSFVPLCHLTLMYGSFRSLWAYISSISAITSSFGRMKPLK